MIEGERERERKNEREKDREKREGVGREERERWGEMLTSEIHQNNKHQDQIIDSSQYANLLPNTLREFPTRTTPIITKINQNSTLIGIYLLGNPTP